MSKKKPINLHITAQNGMLNIDTDDISYSNIRNMYVAENEDTNGHGLQLSESLETQQKQIATICSSIADKIYELQDLLSCQINCPFEIDSRYKCQCTRCNTKNTDMCDMANETISVNGDICQDG